MSARPEVFAAPPSMIRCPTCKHDLSAMASMACEVDEAYSNANGLHEIDAQEIAELRAEVSRLRSDRERDSFPDLQRRAAYAAGGRLRAVIRRRITKSLARGYEPVTVSVGMADLELVLNYVDARRVAAPPHQE
jgi:hypothetical protein